ncbi:hypothetical protein BpHYR1_027899 [Brachionus plicatilis]|uniref:Uncharacterized protein n=1 Tax=Brachionus plicatilis TaxID=10195 RepID=A0A3M7R0D1_BRAPC|nr:hypothetical protein BpHYR1_027899 [Brachionus plicatilis]
MTQNYESEKSIETMKRKVLQNYLFNMEAYICNQKRSGMGVGFGCIPKLDNLPVIPDFFRINKSKLTFDYNNLSNIVLLTSNTPRF